MRRALGLPEAIPTGWRAEPVGYRVINQVTAGLFRVSGTAATANGPRPWVLFLKLLRHGATDSHFASSDDPVHWNYWRREALVYESDLLGRLPPGLAAPRCYGVSAPSPDTLWLWLEPVDGLPAAAWPPERFGQAARHLGMFQGGDAACPPPERPWLSRGWLRAWVPAGTDAAPELLADPAAWGTVGLPGSAAATASALWRQRERLIATVERLPQTLCHLDFWPPNLLARRLPDGRDQTVLLDWAQAGRGALGEDIATLVLDSVWMFSVDPAALAPFERLIWQGYRAGLVEAGWAGDLRQVRLAFALTAGLRFGLLGGGLLRLAADPARHAELERRYGRSIDRIIAARAAAVAYGLALGEEGLALSGELAPFLH